MIQSEEKGPRRLNPPSTTTASRHAPAAAGGGGHLRDWSYQPLGGYWDEALKPSGMPRTHWRRLALALARMGRRQLDRRWRAGQQLIQTNGISYNVYGDPKGKDRAWPMDPIPLVLDGEEWARLETAIAQRAALLNAILADVYGRRALLEGRWLPREIVFAHPGFLRACDGITPRGGVWLHSYAADLARSPDGQWWVITDRTQAPSGAGYALENRLVSARTLPNAFSQCPVRPLARFFQAWLEGLRALAPPERRIAVLTPGPYNETYFEHSYLARYWGLPLVEGADLTVRDQRVFLKTLDGLEPVDVIVRRQDDLFCDPLELRSESLLGVPGLMQAVRAGNVVMANAIGSGVMETSAHMAFLPGLCRHLLGENLLLPSVATWWCGEPGPRRWVLEHLSELVIKPAFPRFGEHPVFGERLDAAAREALARRIEERPGEFVAQEQVALSTAPVWTEDGLTPRHTVLRVFAVWDGERYQVMPGGLTRVSTSSTSLVVSMQQGGGSKDTWVTGSEETGAQRAAEELTGERAPGGLPSRAADNLFWLGRYVERVEAIVRLARVLLPGLSGEEDFGQAVSLETALRVLVGYGHLPEGVLENSLAEQRRQMQSVLTTLVCDPSGLTGLAWEAKQVRRVAWQLKDRLSADTWRVVRQLEEDLTRPPHYNPEQRIPAILTLLDRAIVTLSAFAGLVMENTTRGPGWRFLDIGRRLERALQIVELVRHGLAEAADDAEPYLELLLQAADSTITYRSRNTSVLREDLVLELLLGEETNPRSLAFQLATLGEHMHHLPGSGHGAGVRGNGAVPVEQRLADGALAAVRGARFDGRPAVAALLDEVKTALFDLSEALTGKYLTHVMPSRLQGS